jgi:dihydroorotate dehydrogenase (fumarate)
MCPAKDRGNPDHRAIDMAPQAPLRAAERENYQFFLNLPEADRTRIKLDVKHTQLLQPLFEYSGACAGCGETPYVKLMTQLFGDRAMIANATGCSSIYGGNLPTTPYTTNRDGRGPAWANSLFDCVLSVEFRKPVKFSQAKLFRRLMDLATRYLGLVLPHPFMPGASPLDENLDTVVRLEDAGAAALVMHSLFEEDITSYAPASDRYLERLLRIRRRLAIPVIASLNGTTASGWLRYARMIEQAGASALELNFYHVPTDLTEDAAAVERRVIDIVAVLKESIRIALAVKLSPFYSSLPHLAAELDRIGADGLVLFNRFFQPDIDLERREAALRLQYSDQSELLLRLHWIAILYGRLKASLALGGGVHDARDAVKAVMAGADAVQIVSAILQHGPERLSVIRRGFEEWADTHRVSSIAELRGCASLARGADRASFERGNYVAALKQSSVVSPES